MNHTISVDFAARTRRALTPLRERLARHPVYDQLDSTDALRSFMQAHVFAVWDFMSLVKTLQQRITCVSVPWRPPEDPESARIINQVVLGEESDVTADGRVGSHFELYVAAMREVDADTRPIVGLLGDLRAGLSPERALARADIHDNTRAFVQVTLHTLSLSTHEVAASFLLGRETLIPRMFERILETTSRTSAPTLHWYLRRHIEMDGEEHAPAGWRLLERQCGDDPARWRAAACCARRALRARSRLWDGVCEGLGR
jgi:hypothetical protein